MPRRVVITGMGWITPLGHGIDAVWERLLRGESGVAPTTNFDARTFPTTFSAEVKNFQIETFLGPDTHAHRHAGRQVTFALAAAKQAWADAGLDKATNLDRSSIGIYLGGGEGPIDFENFTAAAIGGWE